MANTSAPISEVAVANFAGTTLEDAPLTSLDDDSALGRFMTRNFGYVRDEVLRSFPWPFAKKRLKLSPASPGPEFGWQYRYILPSDCLRLLQLRTDGEWNVQSKPPPYELEGREILTDCGPTLPIIYIRRVTNAAEFDPLFARAFGERMAVMAAQRITGKGSYVDKARALLADAMAEAKHVASLEMGSPEDQNGYSIVNARAPGL